MISTRHLKGSIFLGVMALAVWLVGCAPAASGPAQPYVPGDAAGGKALYAAAACAKCHGPAGKGIPGSGSDLTSTAKRLKQPDPNVLDFLKLGHPKTDQQLTETQWKDLLAYVRTLEAK